MTTTDGTPGRGDDAADMGDGGAPDTGGRHHDAARSAWLIAVNALLDRLCVTPVQHEDGGISLFVIVPEDVCSENDVQTWWLDYEDGEWHHWQAGTHGQLGDMLRAIACCYVDREVSP